MKILPKILSAGITALLAAAMSGFSVFAENVPLDVSGAIETSGNGEYSFTYNIPKDKDGAEFVLSWMTERSDIIVGYECTGMPSEDYPARLVLEIKTEEAEPQETEETEPTENMEESEAETSEETEEETEDTEETSATEETNIIDEEENVSETEETAADETVKPLCLNVAPYEYSFTSAYFSYADINAACEENGFDDISTLNIADTGLTLKVTSLTVTNCNVPDTYEAPVTTSEAQTEESEEETYSETQAPDYVTSYQPQTSATEKKRTPEEIRHEGKVVTRAALFLVISLTLILTGASIIRTRK